MFLDAVDRSIWQGGCL